MEQTAGSAEVHAITVADHRWGLAAVLSATVAWSTAGYFTRLIPFDAWTILFWRGLFGTATAFTCLAVSGRATFTDLRAIGWPGLLYAGLSTLGMLAFVSALKLTTVAHVTIIYAILPFVAAIVAWLALGERTRRRTLVASGVAFGGVALTVIGGAGEGTARGDLLALAMTLLMAGMITVARHGRAVPMIPAAGLSALPTAAVSLPFATRAGIGAHDMLLLAAFGASNMGPGLILFTVGSQRVPAAESALIGALDTPLAPFWVWLAFGETPGTATLGGGALVLAAVFGHLLAGTTAPQRIRVRTVPTPSTIPSSRSPRVTAATPSGVPVKIRSPGARRTKRDR